MKAFVRRSVLVISVFAVVGTCLWGANSIGLFKITKIEVLPKDTEADSASFVLLKSRIEANLASLFDQPVWEVKIPQVIARVKTEKWIRDVYVNRSILGELKIWIRPREVAAVLLNSSGEIQPVALDGSLLPAVESDKIPDAPFLTGPQLFGDQSLRVAAVAVIESLPVDGDFSRDNISEIFYEKKDGFTLVLTEGGTKVYLGQKSSPPAVARVSQVLNYLRVNGKKAKSVDARFNLKVLVQEN